MAISKWSDAVNMGIAKYTNWHNNTMNAKMNTNKKYLIIKMGGFQIATSGLGFYVLYMLRGIRFALENDFIPVIDWKNCKIPQYDASKAGIENVWEYFFEQPFHVSVEQAYESNDFFVIDDVREFLNKNSRATPPPDFDKMGEFDNDGIMEWRKCFQKYIRLKKEVKEYFDRCRNQQFGDNGNIVGILARGTDYKELKPAGHFCSIPVDEIFACADDLIKAEETRIYLATEDNTILKSFENRYPGKVYSVDAKRYENLGNNTINLVYKEENGYERDLKYLYSLYVISQCPMCIYSACGGGLLASFMRKDKGDYYRFLCNGHNKAKGIIVGSCVEKEQGSFILMGNKPLMFYALNTLKLSGVNEVDIIVSNEVKASYQELTGSGENFGLKINYVVSDTYDVMEYMAINPDFMQSSKLVLLYADYFVHGKDIVKELAGKANEFDGAYAWGVKKYFSDDSESIQINRRNGIPEEAFESYRAGNYSLMGKYIFDYELNDIIRRIVQKKRNPTLSDVLNEYIRRKKLFFLEYKRGIVYSRITDTDTLDKTDQMINLMEDLQGQKIGDFEAWRRI